MNVWILNHYAEPPARQATRSYDLGRELVARGHRVTIFASSFSYYRFEEEHLAPGETHREETIGGVRFFWLRTTPYRVNDWRRVLNMVSYARRAVRVGGALDERPDVVIGVSVHPLAALAGWRLARRKGARFFFEVTDLWPQTLVDLGRLSPAHPLTWLLRRLERFLYRRAEKIISLLPNIHAYLEPLGIPGDRVVWIPNGVDLSRYAALRDYGGGGGGPFTIMYVGGHVQSNALDVVLDAARIEQERGRAVRFVFVGDGVDKPRLMERARDLRNVEFRGLVPKDALAGVMAEADAFVFSLRDLPLYRYGISLNKLCDYLASGRPILFAGRSTYDAVDRAQAGLTVPPEDPAALADAIDRLAALPPAERARMGRNGYEYCKQYHAIPVLAGRLEAALVGGAA